MTDPKASRSAPHSSPPLLPPPPPLDPPFRGYIESTLDALLVFEAARRGMIPRVTRRLIERERGMVQSGAVFVFDEHESGIKRWTDGMVWSPSRILGNFLVYRETDKRPPTGSPTATPTAPDLAVLPGQQSNYYEAQQPGSMNLAGLSSQTSLYPVPSSLSMNASGSGSGSGSGSISPLPQQIPIPSRSHHSPIHLNSKPQLSAASVSGFAQPPRQRSTSEGNGHGQQQQTGSSNGNNCQAAGSFLATGLGVANGRPHVQVVVERQRERSLVGSLTGSFKFKDGGLVKKTMSVNVNGFAQHMVSYYSVEDVVANRLRTPSSLPELLALDISPEYLQKQNFRFPPVIDVGADGIPRYAGEPEEAANNAGSANGSATSTVKSPKMDPNQYVPGLIRPSSSGSILMSPQTPPEYGSAAGPVPGFFESQQMQHLGCVIPEGAAPSPTSQSTPLIGQPSFAQASSHLMQPPHSAGSGMMLRQASDGGPGSRRSGMTGRGNNRFDPYSYTPPNTAPVYSSAAMSSSLPSHYAETSTMAALQQRRLSDSYTAVPHQLVMLHNRSPPSPLRIGSSGGTGSGRSSMSGPTPNSNGGYSPADALGSVPELPAAFPEAIASASYPRAHMQSGVNYGSAWPPSNGTMDSVSYLRPGQGMGFKGSPIQTNFGNDVRYASLGSAGLPLSPMAMTNRSSLSASYRSASEGSIGMYNMDNSVNSQYADEPSSNVMVYSHDGGAMYQATNNMDGWGREQMGLVPVQMPEMCMEQKPMLASLQGGQGQEGTAYYDNQAYGRY